MEKHLNAVWDSLREHARLITIETDRYGEAFQGLDVWPEDNDDEEDPWEVAWRRVAQALELLALVELLDRDEWRDAVSRVLGAQLTRVRGPAPTRPPRQRDALATLSRAPRAGGGDCGEEQRSERLVIPVEFRIDLAPSLPSLAPFERIRQAHRETLFVSSSGACPFRLVKLSANIRAVAGAPLSDVQLRHHVAELRQSPNVSIATLDIAGFGDDVSVAARREWLQTVIGSSGDDIVRLSSNDARIRRILCDVPSSNVGDAAALASTLMHARDVAFLKLRRCWLHPRLWPWAMHTLFSSTATHSFTSLGLNSGLTDAHIAAMDRLSAASDRHWLVLGSQRSSSAERTRVVYCKGASRASVRAGVSLRVWNKHAGDLCPWKQEIDGVYDVLAQEDRDVFLLVPHVGVCVVDRSDCEFEFSNDEERTGWNFEHHSIRTLTLRMNMTPEEDLDEDDEEEDEQADAERTAPPVSLPPCCRFISRIGRPLESLVLNFDCYDPLDTVLQLIPKWCPNLKRLSIDYGRLRSFNSVLNLYTEGLALESLTMRCSSLTEADSIEAFTDAVRDPTSIVGRSLREITIQIHEASLATDERLLRGMHDVATHNHHIRWMFIEVAREVANRNPEMVASIETLSDRYHTWTPLHSLAFISVLETASRAATTRIPCADVLARLDSTIASRILRFAADGDGAWGEIQLRY